MSDSALTKARTHLHTAWSGYMTDRNLHARIPDWRTETAADGSPILTVQAVGRGAEHALAQFVRNGQIGLHTDTDTRPAVDYSRAGRVAYVWRFYGVWVELWVPDGTSPEPEPVPVPVVAPVARQEPSGTVLAATLPVKPSSIVRARRGLGARLPFTRRRKETNPA